MIIVKFGGTSVGSAEAIERTAQIVKSKLDRKPVVVVSALGGATNALLAIGQQAAKGHLIGAMSNITALRERHLEECEKLLGSTPEGNDVASEISVAFDEMATLVAALSVLGYATPRSLDAIAATGERCSAEIVAAFFRKCDVPAVMVDAREVVITNDDFMHAVPKPDAIAERARERVLPLIQDGKVPVMGGFIGATPEGITTTLGRGGSDYSASLIGAALHAETIEIWTDVDGMLTADPRVVEGAQLIDQIRFDEASELASFGAKVLHPSTIAPAVKLGIPVYIYNSKKPEGTGTRITFEAPLRPVSAIAGKTDITVVKVRAAKMLFAHGFLRTVFEIFDRYDTSIDVVATSEVSVSVTVDDASNLENLMADLRMLGDVSIERSRGIVAVVGAGISGHADTMGRALSALAGTKIHMMSLSATGINLTIIVDAHQVQPVMRTLHSEFFSSEALS